jgi:sugar/nucleoside kinase (ribokinase family)
VTVDVIDGERVAGGPVSYGARVASAFGIRARILTIAGDDPDLSPLEGHDVHVVRNAHTLTFEIDDQATGRLMRVPHQPNRAATASDLPRDWRTPRTVMVAPLLRNDIDVESLAPVAQQAERAGILTQGLQRTLDSTGVMHLAPPPASSLIHTCSSSYSFFRSAREASLWSEEQLAWTRSCGARLITTRGAQGALVEGDERFEVGAFPARATVDATGAGDVFATALILALDEGERAAAEIAAAFAAASVEQIGPAPLPSLSEIKRRLDAGRSAADEQMRGARA